MSIHVSVSLLAALGVGGMLASCARSDGQRAEGPQPVNVSKAAVAQKIARTATMPTTADYEKAEEEIVRLPPSAFPEMPESVKGELQRRGCTVPQTSDIRGRHNVISGRFLSAETTDWAVLCSRDSSSALLVFPGGQADAIMELERSRDKNWLQGAGQWIVFSHAIGVATPDFILASYKAYGGPTPPPLDHDGINVMFLDKASGVRYWHNGRWLVLQGAD